LGKKGRESMGRELNKSTYDRLYLRPHREAKLLLRRGAGRRTGTSQGDYKEKEKGSWRATLRPFALRGNGNREKEGGDRKDFAELTRQKRLGQRLDTKQKCPTQEGTDKGGES